MKEKYQIFDQEKNFLATIEFHEDAVGFVGKTDSGLAEQFKKWQKTGIDTYRDISDDSKQKLIMQTKKIKPGEKGYAVALISHLRRSGYGVVPDAGQVKAEVLKLLTEYSEFRAEKDELVRALSTMSYLEATSVLELFQSIAGSPEKRKKLLKKLAEQPPQQAAVERTN